MNFKPILFISIIITFIGIGNKGYGQKEINTSRKDFKKKVFVAFDFVDADIETYATFAAPNSLLVAKIGLEQNLGLTNSKVFFSGNILWRITPKSSIFCSYYWIHRSKTYTINEDIPYLDKYLPKGSKVDVYFNTNVLNIGYMLTFIADKRAFLGGYFNIYLLNLKTGASSNQFTINENLNYFAPVPNFGLFSTFEIASWLELRGSLGLFYLRFDGYTEKVNDANLLANFKPTKWLGIHVGYKVFELYLMKTVRNIDTSVEYHFRGPSLGMTFRF